MTANRLFRTARGLNVGGVKIFYGFGPPDDQADLPVGVEVDGAFYFDGLNGVTYMNIGAVWTISGGGSAEYIRFDNTATQFAGSPVPATVQAALEALKSIFDALQTEVNNLTASDIAFDNTAAALLGSPVNVQMAMEVIDSRVDDAVARIVALEENPGGGGAPAADWQVKTADFNIVKGGYYLVDTSALVNQSPPGRIIGTLPPLAQLDETFIAYVKDAKGTLDIAKFTVRGSDVTSPLDYTVMGGTEADVDYAYADLTIAFDNVNKNILL